MKSGNTVLVDVEVLVDQPSQQLVRRPDDIVIQQRRRALDRGQRPLGVLCRRGLTASCARELEGYEATNHQEGGPRDGARNRDG